VTDDATRAGAIRADTTDAAVIHADATDAVIRPDAADAAARHADVTDAAATDLPWGGSDPADQPAEEPDTRPLDELLDEIYHGQERISQADIYRRAVAADLPAALLTRIAALPQGEYAADEAAELLGSTVA
jgi:hypothetical protein